MKVLDLFCCKGGSAKGILNAIPDAEIIGIDKVLNHQEDYPGKFVWLDIRLLEEMHPELLKWADFIWASPPCQAYTYASKKARNKGKKYPDMVAFTREMLNRTGKPYVIENVTTAPIRKDLFLCGEMFGLKVIRHRAFEIRGFECIKLQHRKHKGKVKDGFYVTVAGHGGDGKASLKAFQDAMQINWTKDKQAICQAVPPKYSEYIMRNYLQQNDIEELMCPLAVRTDRGNGLLPTDKSVGIRPTIL